MNRWLAAILIGALCGLGAANAHAWYEGQIVDADTKEPIAGVVVFMDWQQAMFDHGHEFRDAFETLTDEQGRFITPILDLASVEVHCYGEFCHDLQKRV